jgi:transcriptional regulator with XRE-family HTH domain
MATMAKVSAMPRRSFVPMPSVGRALTELGLNIRLARQRRQLSAQLVAERSGLSRPTLRAVERGDPRVTLGAVATVLNTLGLADDLAVVARNDELGRKLEDAKLLTKRVRAKPRSRAGDEH